MDPRSRGLMLAHAGFGALLTMCAVRSSAEELEGHAVHEHGRITINVALERQQFSVQLEAPAVNVVGFEHTPRTEQERAAASAVATLLRTGAGIVGVPQTARCRLTATSITSPSDARETESEDAQHEAAREHHAEYEASFTYRCEAPEKLLWFELWLIDKLRGVREARVNVITASGQRSQLVRSARERVPLGDGRT